VQHRGEGGCSIGILSRNAALYSTRRLVEAAQAQGHAVRVLDTLACGVSVGGERGALLYGGETLGGLDVVIPRIGASVTGHGLAVVRQLELAGVAVLNGSEAIATSRDKLRCLQRLAGLGLRVPASVLVGPGGDLAAALRRVGGLPAIVKLTRGTQGIGVMLAQSRTELESLLGTMHELGQELLLQAFVAESAGSDVRVLVLDGRAVAAMRRTGRRGEFRSNLHRGGAGECLRALPESYRQAAEQAASGVGLGLAGVDLLEGAEGPLVMEVNSSPGFEGLEKACGVDAAGAIIAHAAALARTRPGARHVATG